MPYEPPPTPPTVKCFICPVELANHEARLGHMRTVHGITRNAHLLSFRTRKVLKETETKESLCLEPKKVCSFPVPKNKKPKSRKVKNGVACGHCGRLLDDAAAHAKHVKLHSVNNITIPPEWLI